MPKCQSLRKDKAAGKITEDQFNELNRRLRPEFGRKADRTQVSMDRSEDVPPFVTDMETDPDQNPDFVEADQGKQAQLRVVEISVVVILPDQSTRPTDLLNQV